jgi:hypothetical protein
MRRQHSRVRSRDRWDSEMSLPTTSPLPTDAPESVFVDESGRRRARTRIVARTIVAGAGIYVLVVIAGLTGSVSLPGAHLGVLGGSASGRASASRLGPGSKAVPLPSALRRKHSTTTSTRAVATPPRGLGSAPGATSSLPGGAIGPTHGQPSPGNPTTTTTRPTPTTTPTTTTTTPPVTTTTKVHGPPTSTVHGPPVTKPGLGKGRTTP